MEFRHSLAADVFDKRESATTRGFLARNYTIALHDHDFYEINIVLSGSGTHCIEGSGFDAQLGDVFVIPPGVVHGYEGGQDNFNVFHLIAKQDFFHKYKEDINTLSGFRLLFEIEPYIRPKNRRAFLSLSNEELDFVRKMLSLFDTMKERREEYADTVRATHTLTVIGYLSGLICDAERIPRGELGGDGMAIMRCMEYIRTNLSEKLTVDDLAKIALMSRATLIRKFKAICNQTPHEFITSCRISEAKRLLSAGKSRAYAAHASGFYDLSHMERTLKCNTSE